MKAIIILMILLGLLMYALVVATATPNDREQYEAYMRWKERKRNADDFCSCGERETDHE